MILEACVGSLEEALLAEKQGAHQIELCDRLDLDGTSPSISTIKLVTENLNIPIKVIVNPNPFNYTYSAQDVKNIETYVEALNILPIEGIVFGPIDKKGQPDLNLIRRIAGISNFPITFHKAIDATNNIEKCTKMLCEQNIIKFILSSGGHKTALLGADTLAKMDDLLKDSQINLIAAGSITDVNLSQLHEKLNLNYYHGKRIVGPLN